MTIDKDCPEPEANSQEQAQYSVRSSDDEESVAMMMSLRDIQFALR
jgi:hypothetical protein